LYPDEQLDGAFFGITPSFILDVMQGDLAGTVVILMGCDGLSSTDMVQALGARGAESVIGWDGPVSAHHTDQTALSLIQSLVLNGRNGKASVDALAPAARDPAFGSDLRLYTEN
jgi:hypothetical protein